ncbi:MAG: ribosome maturation factor RimM [Candidatus Nanopelagicales bacterium]
MRVVVAKVGRALGVRGDVLIDVRTDEPDRRLVPGAPLLVAESDRVLHIESVRDHSGRLCVHFEGVDDRTAAEGLTGLLLEVERAPDERPEDPDEFYDDSLIGLRVVTVEGDEVGVVAEVLHLPAQDVLAVRAGEREVLVPFVVEMVPTVDLDAGRIVIRPPEGLLEIEDS